MKSTHRLTVIAAALVFSVSLAHAQEGPDLSARAEEIANWPAPAFWEPSTRRAFEVSGDEQGRGQLGLLGAAVTSPLPFIGIDPCRIADTRGNGFSGQAGPPALSANVTRMFQISGTAAGVPAQCGIPLAAQAVSFQFTIIQPSAAGNLIAWPSGPPPSISVLNWSGGIFALGNGIVVPVSGAGRLNVFVNAAFGASAQLTIDVNGYYAAAGAGNFNTFLGLYAGNFTMTGFANTGIGEGSLFLNTTGSNNTAIGESALVNNTSGAGNTATGRSALFSSTTGSGNIAIGFSAGSALLTGSDNIYVGNVGADSESGQIRIGTNGVHNGTVIQGVYGGAIAGLGVVINAGGRLGTTTSSRRFKESIRDIDDDSDGLMSLRPVAFKYKPQIDPTGLAQYGLIAEEVADTYPELVAYDRDGQPQAVRYHLVNALLLNEVQKQRRTIEQQGVEIEELRDRLSQLEARLLAH